MNTSIFDASHPNLIIAFVCALKLLASQAAFMILSMWFFHPFMETKTTPAINQRLVTIRVNSWHRIQENGNFHYVLRNGEQGSEEVVLQ